MTPPKNQDTTTQSPPLKDEPDQLGTNWTTEDKRDFTTDLDLKFPKAPLDPIEQDQTTF